MDRLQNSPALRRPHVDHCTVRRTKTVPIAILGRRIDRSKLGPRFAVVEPSSHRFVIEKYPSSVYSLMVIAATLLMLLEYHQTQLDVLLVV